MWRRSSDTAARERNPALTDLGFRGRQIHPGIRLKSNSTAFPPGKADRAGNLTAEKIR